ncbi:unnamed protein product [Zymoseptoria tritici ST99CH_3D7]|uniref:Uncharacterized protein n=2 Tax=Zymoseptoria tritici TaxID=1047171 RepID=A0A1X7RYG8_ZYMT9|nr:unnamed protein product [Zymoseptoria tritici ST99CH_3D7]SMR54552.1 unnamed protein product [Zymoseptoria tritici ST99CH_1E4]
MHDNSCSTKRARIRIQEPTDGTSGRSHIGESLGGRRRLRTEFQECQYSTMPTFIACVKSWLVMESRTVEKLELWGPRQARVKSLRMYPFPKADCDE